MPTFITLSYPDASGQFCEISNYLNECIVLSTAIPVFGCGAVYARIWHAGMRPCNHDIACGCGDGPDIRLITELGL